MIKKFGFRNFCSFKDGTEINFAHKGHTPEVDSAVLTCGNVLGIKGANGSGKTNILKAITFLYCFCLKRMKTTVDSSDGGTTISIPVDTFCGNEDITEFYIEFIIDETTYIYEIDLKRAGIVREELRRKNKKEVVCIVRQNNKVTHCLKEFEELKRLKLKLDQSIISLFDDFDFNAPMHDLLAIYKYFSKIRSNVNAHSYQSFGAGDYFAVSKFYHHMPEALEFTKCIISGVDDGITDITIEETVDKSTGEARYYPLFIHDHGEYKFSVDVSDESMGTKSLFLYLYRYWMTINHGGLLVLDEFDTHLHAMILPEIIELFTNKNINKHNAQFIMTAHNTEVIDSLGRYRAILVNKENNESFCYRLDEVSLLRNDRLISPLYSKGKIGGTPKNIQGLTARMAELWSHRTDG